MNKRSLKALIVLNAVLLVALAVSVFAPAPQEAYAQFGGRADYLMIAGETTGRPQQATVYIINLRTAQMVSVIFNSDNNSLTLFGGRDVARDMEQLREGR